ncbi:unnamed protein product [Arabidopsis halleri]
MRGLLISFFIFLFLHFSKAQLRVGFYSTNCPTGNSRICSSGRYQKGGHVRSEKSCGLASFTVS